MTFFFLQKLIIDDKFFSSDHKHIFSGYGQFIELVECIKNEIKICAILHWSLLLGSYNKNDDCYNPTFEIHYEPPCKHHYDYCKSWINLLMC